MREAMDFLDVAIAIGADVWARSGSDWLDADDLKELVAF